MSVTIQDVAEMANVSTATVSRVINNTKDVSETLKKRVYDAIEESGYRPNSLARGLVTKKTNTIGIILPDISNPIFGALTKGINYICQKRQYSLMVCDSGGIQKKELELLDVLAAKKIDGLLFAGVDVNDILVEKMREEDYPILLVTQEASGEGGFLPTIAHNNIQAMYDAVTFLLKNGHQRIAFISGSKHDYSSGRKRMIGYQKALRDRKIDILDSYIEYGDFTFESGYRSMKKICERNNILPTAVMVSSDLMAIGAMKFLKKANISVPKDISIMGFDDSELARYSSPELSTVRVSYFEEGKLAAKELFRLIDGKELARNHTIYIPHKIIHRNSVKTMG